MKMTNTDNEMMKLLKEQNEILKQRLTFMESQMSFNNNVSNKKVSKKPKQTQEQIFQHNEDKALAFWYQNDFIKVRDDILVSGLPNTDKEFDGVLFKKVFNGKTRYYLGILCKGNSKFVVDWGTAIGKLPIRAIPSVKVMDYKNNLITIPANEQ